MLKASYEQIRSDANSISKAAEDYQQKVSDIYNVVDNLVNNWQGADNVSFAEKVNSYKENIQALGNAVNNYANFLNKSASTISETQSDIASAANRL